MWTMTDGFAISDTMLTLKIYIAKDIVWDYDLEILQCRNIASNVDLNTFQKNLCNIDHYTQSYKNKTYVQC